MSMGAVMTVENKAVYLENVDDGTGTNPQKGFFAVKHLVGPFETKKGAEEYLKNAP